RQKTKIIRQAHQQTVLRSLQIEDYQPKTAPARANKAQFLRQFPYVALKRSEFGERFNKAADAFERRNERVGAKLCA
ncbi:hypothetical protein, partial [Gluconobacter aidae]|uniref:hypothetical protein n=1 Tax=Gluconobacter aidae TaxID=2662454 RepID=UPI001E2EC719